MPDELIPQLTPADRNAAEAQIAEHHKIID